MRHARQYLLLGIVACIHAPTLWAQSTEPTPRATAATPAADLTRERALIEESDSARKASDYDLARSKVAEAVAALIARPEVEQDAAWLALLNAAGNSASYAQDPRTARTARQRVFDVRSRTLPDDHPDLQRARANLAIAMSDSGDLAGARVLEEKVLDVRSRTLPDDHPDLQKARGNLAATISALGDLPGARALEEKVLEVRSRTHASDHPDLQRARANLAYTIKELGDLAGARALEEKALEVFSRTLPDDHADLQSVRSNLALTLRLLGDVAGARALFEKVLEVRSRTLPDAHPDLQMARGNLAGTLYRSGDRAGARALFEKVLEVHSRTLPDDHPDLQRSRLNLAVTLRALGELAGARTLEEKVLEVRSRTLPDAHPDLQWARNNLGLTIRMAGDFAGARALFEKVLEVRLRTLPDDHPDLQKARGNLAGTIAGQLARAAWASASKGGVAEGIDGDRERCADLVGAVCRAQVRAARDAMLGSPSREAEERCASLAQDLDSSLSFAGGLGVFEPMRTLEKDSFVLAETTRGAALVSAELARKGASAPKYAELRAALRDAGDELVALTQKGTTSGEFDRARTKRESAERELVALARELSGGKHSGVELDVESLAASLEAHETAVSFRLFKQWRIEVVGELDSTGQPAVRDASADRLCAFVVRSTKADAPREATSALTLVDLGPIAPIEEAVRAWRAGLGAVSHSRGLAAGLRAESAPGDRMQAIALREKIFDPLLLALAGAHRIVVALDDVLHLVPLDALPLDEGTLVGDRWQIETRTTLTELLRTSEPFEGSGQLVAFGDIEYGAETTPGEDGLAPQLAAADVKSRNSDDAGLLRGSAWSEGFSALPGTGIEVRGIARCFRAQFGTYAASELCERGGATRERLLALAPQARWLHIATHGWFAPDSIRSWSDPEPLDKQTGLGSRTRGDEQVKGMSPMLLCGLALARANLPQDATGRVPGLVTADELSTLDLSNCDLVVLSACDTNAGARRAGQGVASLQKALQMAGARSVITSLWKVPDEATKELMLDFYRRLWVEKKPKRQALWEAKQMLRAARDEKDQPIYSTRDWAAWVLTGNPD